MNYPEYYHILNVKVDASPEEIKTAYRKLVKEYHPDTHKGDKKAEERLKKINEAYNTLKDLGKRAEYDYYGRLDKEAQQKEQSPVQEPQNTAQPAHITRKIGIKKYLFRKLFAIALFIGYILFLRSNADSQNPDSIVLMLNNSAKEIHMFIKNTAETCKNFSWRSDLIYLTAKIGNEDLMKWVLEHTEHTQEDLNTPHRNPLMATSSPQIADLLLKAGADVNYTAADGETALLKAVCNQNVELVRLFLQSGADADVADIVSIAQRYSDQSIYRLLLQHGAKRRY